MTKQQLYELIEEIEQEIKELMTPGKRDVKIKGRILQLCENARIERMIEERQNG
jgi:hypothetical protein